MNITLHKAYQIFENDKPASTLGYPNLNPSWWQDTFFSFEEAKTRLLYYMFPAPKGTFDGIDIEVGKPVDLSMGGEGTMGLIKEIELPFRFETHEDSMYYIVEYDDYKGYIFRFQVTLETINVTLPSTMSLKLATIYSQILNHVQPWIKYVESLSPVERAMEFKLCLETR